MVVIQKSGQHWTTIGTSLSPMAGTAPCRAMLIPALWFAANVLQAGRASLLFQQVGRSGNFTAVPPDP